jgi:4-amino-4-deoxy-L-arabinose transferase-like glycosyltransferase
VVLGASVAAAVLYGWGLSRGVTHYYYSAAVRSMTLSWHNFFFGAFDPSASITTDKLPGSLWVQALFARVLGVHTWVLLLPELLAAVATVPLLFGAVRRWAGPRAGYIAIIVFVLTPAVFATAQVNIPDTLLVLCTVAGAYAVVRALTSKHYWWLLLAAGLAGFAFQVKMTESLLVLPALALAYLVAADKPLRARILATAGYLAVTAVLALSWITVFALVPASSRPRIDGSASNSVWDMVFVYNGIGRTGSTTAALSALFAGPTGPLRLFDFMVGGEASWLIPLAVVLGVAGLVLTRREGRKVVAGWLMWLVWLGVCVAAFSVVGEMHPYYTVLIVPAIAALVGAGGDRAVSAWRSGEGPSWMSWTLPVGVVLTVALAVVFLVRVPVGLGWVVPVTVAAGVVVVLAFLLRGRSFAGNRAMTGVTAAAVAVAVLVAPSVWLFSTPSISATPVRAVDQLAGPAAFIAADEAKQGGAGTISGPDLALLRYVHARDGGERFVLVTASAATASAYVTAGQNVLPLLGFSTESPGPTAAQLTDMVRAHQFRFVLMVTQPHARGNAAVVQNWVSAHCRVMSKKEYDPSGLPSRDPWAPKLHDCVAG